ncbi:MAG TPA: formate/nitrite transporter family protein [Hanamia sp.]|nr:formate/nitrite transporter family protein [Hanamia sp.]
MARKKSLKEEEKKPQKSQQLILKHTEEAALTELNRSPLGLMLSGLSGGLDIGFSVLMMSVVLTLFKGVFQAAVVQFFVATMYPLGFMFVVLGRSELFTEHTTLAVLPVLQGLAPIKRLLRLWGIIYFSNIVGGLIFSLILCYFGNTLHFIQSWALAEISIDLVAHTWMGILLSAALAGWLMGLLAWLVAAARETISQIVIIYIITTCIGLAGLAHSIVGNIEAAVGLINGDISFLQYLNFLLPVTLGNIIGGVFFVAVLKYSHTTLSGKETEVNIEDHTEKMGQ